MIAAIDTPATSWTTDQPRSDRSVSRSVVRRRLRVMLTTTTEELSATDRPRSAAPSGGEPVAPNAAHETAVVKTTWSGAIASRLRASRRMRTRSTSIPTSNRRSTTPTSARNVIWLWSATYPGVNGETASPAAR